ncbi:MAG: hypothetical protein LBG43_05085 [Treponema sp.]|jgi:hypothetical protein|nr:hypothetical protein [Treponema sp.]
MKTKKVMTPLGALIGLLMLAGCDTQTDDGIWLDDMANPFIGTWSYSSTNMSNVTTTTTMEFKTDGAIEVTTKQGENNPTISTVYYLVKDDFLVLSTTSGSYYTKCRFEVIDNSRIRVVQDAGSATIYTRVGAENPNADRTIVLNDNLNGFWRWSINHGTEEGAMFMYDWWTIGTNAAYHVYHYMGKNKRYIDRGEFSYYFDSGNNRLVALSDQYTVTVYDLSNVDLDNGRFQLGARKYEKFDGETFWEANHTPW